MVWTTVVLTNLLIIRGDNVALTVLANLLIYTVIAFVGAYLLRLINKAKYPVGSILSFGPILYLSFYVFVALHSYLVSITSTLEEPIATIIDIVPILIAGVVPLAYISSVTNLVKPKKSDNVQTS